MTKIEIEYVDDQTDEGLLLIAAVGKLMTFFPSYSPDEVLQLLWKDTQGFNARNI